MRVFNTTHWFNDEPNQKQVVLVGVMTPSEMDEYQTLRDRSDETGDDHELNRWFERVVGAYYTEDDFIHYFDTDELPEVMEGMKVDLGDETFVLNNKLDGE